MGACTEKICATVSLISRQRSVWRREFAFSSAVRVSRASAYVVYIYIYILCTDSIYGAHFLIASNIYLLRPFVEARYGRAPLIIAPVRERTVLSDARCFNLATFLGCARTIHIMYTAYSYVYLRSSTTSDDVYRRKGVSQPLQARGSFTRREA